MSSKEDDTRFEFDVRANNLQHNIKYVCDFIASQQSVFNESTELFPRVAMGDPIACHVLIDNFSKLENVFYQLFQTVRAIEAQA